jgi:hypothetical protein
MTDTVISQNIEFSAWDILYIIDGLCNAFDSI